MKSPFHGQGAGKQASDCFGKVIDMREYKRIEYELETQKAELRALKTKERLNESWECLEALGDRLSDPSGAVRNSFNLFPSHRHVQRDSPIKLGILALQGLSAKCAQGSWT